MKVYAVIQQIYTVNTYYEQAIMIFVEKEDLYLNGILAVKNNEKQHRMLVKSTEQKSKST